VDLSKSRIERRYSRGKLGKGDSDWYPWIYAVQKRVKKASEPPSNDFGTCRIIYK